MGGLAPCLRRDDTCRDSRGALHKLTCGAGILLAAVALAFSTAAAADAASYPSRPIRAIVPFPAGSGTDLLARFIGSRLTERVRQQIVVDNRPGANGIIAAEATAPRRTATR